MYATEQRLPNNSAIVFVKVKKVICLEFFSHVLAYR